MPVGRRLVSLPRNASTAPDLHGLTGLSHVLQPLTEGIKSPALQSRNDINTSADTYPENDNLHR